MIGFAEAIAALREVAPAPRHEAVALVDAVGRSTVADLAARTALPTAVAAAMDGFACRIEDAASATPETPVRLTAIGASRTGQPFAGALGPMQAVAVATGAVIPEGADAIAVVEDCRVDGDEVTLFAPPRTKHLRAVGEDLQAGATVLPAGTLLTPLAVGLAAAAGHVRLDVVARPSALVLATGPELRPPDARLGPGDVPDSNAPLVAALLQAHGVPTRTAPSVVDDEAALEAALEAACAGSDRPDLIVTTGGASVGRHDVVRRVLGAAGEVRFDGIRVRPGRPAMLGAWTGVPWLALPGTPHAVAVLGTVLLRAWSETAAGRAADGEGLGREAARLETPLRGVPGRTVLQLGRRWTDAEGRRRTAPLERSDASRMRDLARADALIVVPEGVSPEAGAVVDTLAFGDA